MTIRPQGGYLDLLAHTRMRAAVEGQRRPTPDMSSGGEFSLEVLELALSKCCRGTEEPIKPLSVTIRPQEGYLDLLAPTPMRAALEGQRRPTLDMS